jgi:hypothetical protein
MELSPSKAINCAATQELIEFYGSQRLNFMEAKGSVPCSQEPSTDPYPEPDQSSPYHPILSLVKIYFNIVHLPTRAGIA